MDFSLSDLVFRTCSDSRKKPILWICVVTLLMVFQGCLPTSTLRVYEELYDLDPEFGHDAYVRQSSVDSAYVYFRVRTGHLLHKRKDTQSPFKIDVGFKVLTVSSVVGNSDTIRHNLIRQYDKPMDELVYGRFAIPMRDSIDYEVRIYMNDNVSKKQSKFIAFHTTSGNDHRYFNVLVEGRPSRYCACAPGQTIALFPYGWGDGTAIVRAYERTDGLPPLPFTINPRKPRVITPAGELTLDYKGGIELNCPEQNLLELFQPELNTVLEVPIYPAAFPKMTSHQDMVEVLRFITSTDEYTSMMNADDHQEALERFWITCAGSRERAKVLIEQYYSRVEEANLFFSTHMEGWKTDRGLIHIVYGPPNEIERSGNRETWYYGASDAEDPLEFTFFKEGDYILDRTLDHRPSWYLTMDAWRSGRTISP
ncbi:MAG: GWxTD domain-containing protein [Flavobacteriales bacterium]|nr:GWxTD domain-containing protein [Flavobacteriales bacterium]